MVNLANAPYLYIGSTKYAAVTAWPVNTAKAAGSLIRQNATPTLGNERVFVCIVAGNTNPTTEPVWDTAKGAKTVDNTATWQECTGQPPVNGDLEHTQDWNEASGKVIALGQIIKNVAETHYFICSNPGTAGSGSEPTWNTTAGQTTSDGSVTWTCIGAVGNFGAWGAPHSRLPNALATNWGTNGATFYISNNHAESQTSGWTAQMLGLISAPSYYLCVDDSAAPPTDLATTATISSNSSVTIAAGASNGSFYMYGVNLNCGTGSANASIALQGPSQMYEACSFNLVTTNSISSITLSHSASTNRLSVLRNCGFTFGAAGQSLKLDNGRIEIIGGSVAATGTAPTTAFTFTGHGTSLVRDCNLSGITSNLVNVTSGPQDCIFANCRLGSGVTLATDSIGSPGGSTLRVHNCDSAATNYRMYTAYYWGTSQQNTSTYNDNGATDGTTPISWQVDTNANPYFGQPFISEQIFQWVDTIGSELTATVEVAGSTTLYDDEIWMEIEYLGNASYPLGSFADCRKADVLATRAAVPSSSATWTGSPAVTQKLEVAFTPQMKGPIKARIYVAKKNATVYIDPLITVA